MKDLRIGIDVDEVLANLHDPWVEWGNKKFGTSYTHFDHWNAPTDWWANGAYEFLRPDIYERDIVLPVQGAVEAVAEIRAKSKLVRFVTSCNRDLAVEVAKCNWLARHGFLLHEDEFVPRVNKSNAPVDVLADDGYHNVETFKGRGVLVSASHNLHQAWPERIPHISELINHLSET